MEEKIYIHWMYLIKETTDKEWKVKYQAKMLVDEEVWAELLYWWSEIKWANNIDEAKAKVFIS